MLFQKIIILLQFLCLACYVNYSNHRRISALDGKIPTDVPLFSWESGSSVSCVLSCTLFHGCLSVFLSTNATCHGYSEMYDVTSLNLIEQPGTACYDTVKEEGLYIFY